MSGGPGWISGRFRGIYSSERSASGEGTRRVSIEVERGDLFDSKSVTGPPPGESTDELRFESVARVRSVSDDGVETEHTLHDVRIRGWRLLYPAESTRRLYGTLVGELSGRLSPAPVEVESPPPRRLELTPALAPSLAESADSSVAPTPDFRAPVAAPVQIPTRRIEEGSPEQDVERLLWLVVPLLLGVVGAQLAFVCSPLTASIWLLPLSIAIALRQTPSRLRIQGTVARRWVGGLCLATQGLAMVAPLQALWASGCRPELQLLLLAAPIVVASAIRTHATVWTCALVWTLALGGWCQALDGTCETVASSATPLAATALAPRLARTDPDGRWPASPLRSIEASTPAPYASEEPSETCDLRGEVELGLRASPSLQRLDARLATARARLLDPSDAKRRLAARVDAIVRALAAQRFDRVAEHVGDAGLCLRASKGAACETLSRDQVLGCASSPTAIEWAVDTGEDQPPRYTCSEAIRRIFLARDFLRPASVRYNCFQEPGRGNNAQPVLQSPPARAYVELYVPAPEDAGDLSWRTLWLVFDGEDGELHLTELVSEYWGI